MWAGQKPRVSQATICPARVRNRWSTSCCVSGGPVSPGMITRSDEIDLSDLDRPAPFELRTVARPFDRLFIAVRVDDVVAPQDLLGLAERTVGDENVPGVAADRFAG